MSNGYMVPPRKQYVSEPKAEKPKRSDWTKRKKPLRKVSKKTAALRAVTNPGRKGFVELNPVCMVCQKRKATDCHEICRGNARAECLLHPELFLAVCRICHEDLDDTVKWTVERQIALRGLRDDEMRVVTANQILGTADTYITMEGVGKWRP